VRKKRTRTRKSAKKKSLGKFASSLEKYCSEQLRALRVPFVYEGEQFTLVESFRYENKYMRMTSKKKEMIDKTGKVVLPIRYTPDFMAKDMSWVIETKGFLPSHHDFNMRWKLFLKYLVDNEIESDVYIAKNKGQVDQAIQDIISRHG